MLTEKNPEDKTKYKPSLRFQTHFKPKSSIFASKPILLAALLLVLILALKGFFVGFKGNEKKPGNALESSQSSNPPISKENNQPKIVFETEKLLNNNSSAVLSLEELIQKAEIPDTPPTVKYQQELDLKSIKENWVPPIKKVFVKVLISADGVPRQATLINPEAIEEPEIRKAIQEAALGWRFEPALKNKNPINCWVTIPIAF